MQLSDNTFGSESFANTGPNATRKKHKTFGAGQSQVRWAAKPEFALSDTNDSKKTLEIRNIFAQNASPILFLLLSVETFTVSKARGQGGCPWSSLSGLMEGECLNSMNTNSHLPRNQFKAKIHLLRKARSTAVELMTLSHTKIFRSTPPAWVKFWLIWRCFCCCDVSTSQQRILPFAPGKILRCRTSTCSPWCFQNTSACCHRDTASAEVKVRSSWVFRHWAIATLTSISYIEKQDQNQSCTGSVLSFIKVFLNTMTLTLFQKVRSL